MTNLNFLINIFECLKIRYQLIKLMLFIVVLTCLSILLMLFLIRIESRNSDGYLIGADSPADARCDSIVYFNSTVIPRQYYATINGERYPKRVPNFFNSSIDFDCLNSHTDVKVILIWNLDDFSYGLGIRQPFITHNCPAVNCEITNDKQRISDSDLVLVKYTPDLTHHDLPKLTNPKSLLTLYLTQPVSNLSLVRRFNRIFNLTATFRLTSHILPHYLANVRFYWSPNKDPSTKSYIGLKTGSAAVILTDNFNCSTRQAQIFLYRFVKKLKLFIPVTIFGPCGGKKCEPTKQCRKKIYKTFKFVLLYDPSVKCKDYVNDLFLDAFLYETVPVVFQKLSYDFFVPNSAFIRVYDFNSTEELGGYLKDLNQNSSALSEFFTWKRHIRVVPNSFGSFCDMCIKVNLAKKERNIVIDLEEALRCY